jgi:hypothetical protein
MRLNRGWITDLVGLLTYRFDSLVRILVGS